MQNDVIRGVLYPQVLSTRAFIYGRVHQGQGFGGSEDPAGHTGEDSQRRASLPIPPCGSVARALGGGRGRREHGALRPGYTCPYSRLPLVFILKPHFEIVPEEAAGVIQGPVPRPPASPSGGISCTCGGRPGHGRGDPVRAEIPAFHCPCRGCECARPSSHVSHAGRALLTRVCVNVLALLSCAHKMYAVCFLPQQKQTEGGADGRSRGRRSRSAFLPGNTGIYGNVGTE